MIDSETIRPMRFSRPNCIVSVVGFPFLSFSTGCQQEPVRKLDDKRRSLFKYWFSFLLVTCAQHPLGRKSTRRLSCLLVAELFTSEIREMAQGWLLWVWLVIRQSRYIFFHLSLYTDRAFTVAAPKLWNLLPKELCLITMQCWQF